MIKAVPAIFVVALLAALLSACAPVSPATQPLAPNSIRVTFKNATTDEVLARIGKKCSQVGGVVKEATSDYIVCSRRLSDTDAELVNIPVATVHSAKPENRMKFTASKADGNVTVTTLQWAEVKSKSGDWTQIEMGHAKQKANMKKIMLSIGAI